MKQFAQFCLCVARTAPGQYRLRYVLGMAVATALLPLALPDSRLVSVLMLCAGAVLVCTMWGERTDSVERLLWVIAPVSKSRFIGARLIVALVYMTPTAVATGLLVALRFFSGEPVSIIIGSHLIAGCALAVAGTAVSLLFGGNAGPALLIGLMVSGLAMTPTWEQRFRWFMPSQAFWSPSTPDPVNLMALISWAVLLAGAAMVRVGHGERSDRPTKRGAVAVGLLLLAGTATTDVLDRAYLTTGSFRMTGDAALTLRYRGVTDRWAAGAYRLGLQLQTFLDRGFGLDVSGSELLFYRSRSLNPIDDPGLPQADHTYKIWTNQQLNLGASGESQWAGRLSQDLFMGTWRKMPLDAPARHVISSWGPVMYALTLQAFQAPSGPPDDLGPVISSVRARFEGQSAHEQNAFRSDAGLLLLRILDLEGPEILSRVQTRLSTEDGLVTADALRKAFRESAANPQAVDEQWSWYETVSQPMQR